MRARFSAGFSPSFFFVSAMGQSQSQKEPQTWAPSVDTLKQCPVVTRAAFTAEYRKYCSHFRCADDIMSQEAALAFLRDLGEAYDIGLGDAKALVMQQTRFTLDEVIFFFGAMVGDAVDLSKSMKEQPQEQLVAEDQPVEMVVIRSSNALEPLVPEVFTPPAQMMNREWSLILARPELSSSDLNAVNLVCRFLYCNLRKYPPQHWRTITLESVERRCAEDMTEFLQWERLSSACRLSC